MNCKHLKLNVKKMLNVEYWGLTFILHNDIIYYVYLYNFALADIAKWTSASFDKSAG